MLDTLFATKLNMTQAWLKDGKRVAVTKCRVADNAIVGSSVVNVTDKNSKNLTKFPCTILEVGYGKKKLKNVNKPLREKIQKSGFSFGVSQVRGVRLAAADEALSVGSTVSVDQVFQVGDVVEVQGRSKGRGFAGAVKRYGFKGGPRTHGQSDRTRAVGAIGCRTTPGRVWKGKRMPGHYGDELMTVSGITVLHVDSTNKEIWLSGPIPGSNSSVVKISKTGRTKEVELDKVNSGIKEELKVEAVSDVEVQAEANNQENQEKSVKENQDK